MPKLRRRFTTTLVIPTWNEIDGMRAIMPRVQTDWVDQILLIDGGSVDGTVEYARQQGYDVYVQQQRGIRQAYGEALPLIRGDVILTFSPDGNSIPELIPEILDRIEDGFDMVIASRYLPPAKSADDDLITAFGNWLFTRTVNLLHGGDYTDAMVIYRAYWKELVFALELDQDHSHQMAERLFGTRISWEPLLSVRAAKARLRITEIPGDEPPRIGGTRKLQVLRWGAAYYFQFIRECFAWKNHVTRTWTLPVANLAVPAVPSVMTCSQD